MLSGYVFLSLITYTAWKVWVISNRYYSLDKKMSGVLALEILYFLFMLYLLCTSDPNFLFIAILTISIHVAMGLYVEILRPDIRLTQPSGKDLLLNYWSFLAIDSGITFLSYFLMIGAQ